MRNEKMNNNNFYEDESAVRPSLINIILLNRTLKIVIILIIFCIFLPAALYFSLFYTNANAIINIGVCSIPPDHRVPCGSQQRITVDECRKLKCCMSADSQCYHTLPSRYQYQATNGNHFSPTEPLSPLKTKQSGLILDVVQVSPEILKISLTSDDELARRKNLTSTLTSSAASQNQNDSSNTDNSLFDYKLYDSQLYLDVFRKMDGKLLLTTSRGPLIMSSRYFEWTFYLNCTTIFGLDNLILNEGFKLLMNDGVTNTIPIIIGFDRDDQSYFSLEIPEVNSPTEIQLLKSNTIIVRSMAAPSFTVKVTMGPTLIDIYRHIQGEMYQAPTNFPIWKLGVHICDTSTSNTTESIEKLEKLLNPESFGFPFDSHCIDASFANLLSMEPNNSSVQEFLEASEKLKVVGKKFLLYLYSHVLLVDDDSEVFNEAVNNNLLLLQSNESEIFEGFDQNGQKISYFDYISQSSGIADLISKHKQKFEIFNANGYFTDLNFPFDYLENETHSYLNDFEFVPNNFAVHLENFIPLNTQLASANNDDSLIKFINQYSSNQIEIFNNVFTPDLLISDAYSQPTTRSSNLGNLIKTNQLNWPGFRSVVYKIVFMSTISYKFQGSLVCGGQQPIPEDLCVRWYQFSIFVPLIFIDSNKLPAMFTINAQRIMIEAIKMRYSLMYYINSEMLHGRPLLTPMHFYYPLEDVNRIDQFSFGTCFVIVPVLYQSAREVPIVFPEIFYEFWSGLQMPINRTVHFAVVLSDIPIFIKAGSIVAVSDIEEDTFSTSDLQKFPLYLIIAFNCNKRNKCSSSGEVKFSEQSTLTFTATEKELEIKMDHKLSGDLVEFCGENPKFPNFLTHATIYGLEKFKDKHRKLNVNFCETKLLSESIKFSL